MSRASECPKMEEIGEENEAFRLMKTQDHARQVDKNKAIRLLKIKQLLQFVFEGFTTDNLSCWRSTLGPRILCKSC